MFAATVLRQAVPYPTSSYILREKQSRCEIGDLERLRTQGVLFKTSIDIGQKKNAIRISSYEIQRENSNTFLDLPL